ncbi:MAG: hypothetical protein FK731_09275, partial [Asgard group archaeon]|nr:hypothetical protein [Asgard group archaeon]
MNNSHISYTSFWQKMGENFPYSQYRDEQLLIINRILETSNRIIMIDAETGSGKTAAVLSAVLSKKSTKERILIFTKMLGQMNAWFRELGLINDFHRKLNHEIHNLIPLVAKYRLCPPVKPNIKKQFAQVGCKLFNCDFDKAYYYTQNEYGELIPKRIIQEITDRIKEGISLPEILFIFESKANNYGCPYKILRSALQYAEFVIAPYPFLLNSQQRDILFSSMNLDLANTTIIIDEAHNLAKSTFDTLSYRTLHQAIDELGNHKILEELLTYKEKPGLHSISFTENELNSLQNQGKKYVIELNKKGSREISNALLVHNFLLNLESCFLTADKKFNLYLKDPRTILNPLKLAKQLILLSGTFRPLNNFADFLGIKKAAKFNVLSETLGKNRIVITTSDENLSMKYQERSPERYLYYSQIIKKLADIIPGHTLVFTPNYEISTVLANQLETTYFEKPHQPFEKLKDSLINSKRKEILIAPARGKISEGVEFVKNNRSIISAVIIAGLPYPPPSKSLNTIIKEYSKFWGESQATNYMTYLQAIVSMRQALGRMIRSEYDVGAWII